MTKVFKRYENPILKPFWALFGQIWVLLEKKVMRVFKYSNYLPLCKKLTDGETDRQW